MPTIRQTGEVIVAGAKLPVTTDFLQCLLHALAGRDIDQRQRWPKHSSLAAMQWQKCLQAIAAAAGDLTLDHADPSIEFREVFPQLLVRARRIVADGTPNDLPR